MIYRSKYNKKLSYLFNIEGDNVYMSQGDFKVTITKEMFNRLFEIIEDTNKNL